MAWIFLESSGKEVFNVPLEKVIQIKSTTEVLFNSNNFVPLSNNNQLYTSGYWGEIEAFVNLCEGKAKSLNPGIIEYGETFKLLHEFKRNLIPDTFRRVNSLIHN